MAEDFRIAFDYFDHPKIVRLKQGLGAEGVLCHLRLMSFTGRYRPKGILTGMTEIDICLAAHWPEEPAKFIDALVQIGLLDRASTRKKLPFAIHDWYIHNAFLYHGPERQRVARDNATKRWCSRNNKLADADGKKENQGAQCASHPILNAPTPTPTPTPTPKKRELFDSEKEFEAKIEW